jgi:EAL domain-containing protein (putative c-di-GMP-specific phosphodiesterase class I)
MDIPEDKDNAAIMRAVIAMAHELRLEVIAEGVETEAQLEFLKKCGCDVVQGYLVGSPMQEEGFAAVLKALK